VARETELRRKLLCRLLGAVASAYRYAEQYRVICAKRSRDEFGMPGDGRNKARERTSGAFSFRPCWIKMRLIHERFARAANIDKPRLARSAKAMTWKMKISEQPSKDRSFELCPAMSRAGFFHQYYGSHLRVEMHGTLGDF